MGSFLTLEGRPLNAFSSKEHLTMSQVINDLKEEASHDEQAIDIDPVAEKRLIRKIDLYLMPSAFVLYLFSYVVREC